MPIHTKQAPDGCEAMVRRAVGSMMPPGAPPDRVGMLPVPGDAPSMETAAPHPVYVAGLAELAEGRLLETARENGWRYLLIRGDQAVATATVGTGEGGAAMEFSHVTQGPFVEATVEGLRRAEALDEVASGDYELRLLDVPALYLRALWLHGENGEGEMLIPLPPSPDGIEPYRAYSEPELVGALHAAAVARLTLPDDFGG